MLDFTKSRYEKDTNCVPPQMILQPISKILPNFLNELIPLKQEADQREWWRILCEIQTLFKDATTYLFRVRLFQLLRYQLYMFWNQIFFQSGLITAEDMRRYHNSVIETECTAGIIQRTGKTKNSCAIFLREIKNINLQDSRGGTT